MGGGRRRGSGREEEGEKKNWKAKKGTLAAKLSLNIISLSLVHYLFSKLLRAELAVHGQEVTHYAFLQQCSVWLLTRRGATTQKMNEEKN